MATLQNHLGHPLVDADGHVLKVGSTVIDSMFGEGIARGTVPLEKGDGVNVRIEWLGSNCDGKPPSRGVENLKLAYGAGLRTTSFVTGADYESGAAHHARGVSDAAAVQMRLANNEDGFEEPEGAQTPPLPTANAGRGAAQQTAAPGAQQQAAQAPGEQQHAPWLGKTSKLDTVGKEIISHYVHRIITETKLHGADVVTVLRIKYRTKYEPADKERTMGENWNPTRLGEHLLSSIHTPDEVKESVARKMRSKKALEFVKALDSKKRAGDTMQEQLHSVRKASKLGNGAQEKQHEREQLITKYVVRDAEMPNELFKLILYYLSIVIFMCRLPFSIVMNTHFMRFLWALRPNFAKQMTGRTMMHQLAHDLLDEAYEETKEITAGALAEYPGRPTLGMDGHKEGKHRHVETITHAKLGCSTYAGSEYMRTTRTTGKNLSVVALKYLTPQFIALVADNTGNNTGESTGMFSFVLEAFPTLFCLGCYVHVFDLLIEDIAKLPLLKGIGDDAHFVVSFLKKHGLLFEEFLICQQKLQVKQELVLFPATRFAYLYLMINRVLLNVSVLRLVAESPTYAVVKSATKKRGEEGQKALGEFKRFETLVESREFKTRLLGGVSVMEPFSIVLHYAEGDSVPISHVLALFQFAYEFSQQLDDFDAITDFLTTDEERDAIAGIMQKRWLGEGRLVGLKHDVHLLAYVLDPFAQGARTTAAQPKCDFLDVEVMNAARAALRHFSKDDSAKRAILLQQFMLWNAAAPALVGQPPVVQASGNNAFSALRLDAMQQVWDKKVTREEKLAAEGAQRDEDSSAFAMREAIANLRLTSSPVEFWLAMMNEVPRGATRDQREAHLLFCKSAADICSIVGHTCGVERAGKAYKQVLSSLRKSMDETRAMKAIFVYSNYNLRDHKQSAGDAFSAFNSTGAQQQAEAETETEKHTSNTLRRGNLIFKDVNSDEDDSDSDGDAGEPDEDAPGAADDGEEGQRRSRGVQEISWSVPDGFKVADEPSKLDASLVGSSVYMRWEKFGWQLGRISDVVTNDTPRLVKKFNYRIVWSDGSKGPAKLSVENYGYGSDARYNSWVILSPATPTA